MTQSYPASRTISRIGILGPGAVGGLLAAVYARADADVLCISRPGSSQILRAEGLRVNSGRFGHLHVYPRVIETLDTPVDLLWITTKAFDLESALQRIDPGVLSGALVIPLLNGLEHVEILRKHYGAPVVAGNISIESRCISPGEIEHPSPHALISIGRNPDMPEHVFGMLRDSIAGTGIDCNIVDSEPLVLWDKLVRLCAIAAMTAYTNLTLGEVLENHTWRTWLRECVNEAVSVAATSGCEMSSDTVFERIQTLPATLKTSLQHDLYAGKRIEVDAILGAVDRAGRQAGLNCPRIAHLHREILEIHKAEYRC